MSRKKALRVSVLATALLGLVTTATTIYILWLYELLADGERLPHNDMKEWKVKKKNCEERYDTASKSGKATYDSFSSRPTWSKFDDIGCINERSTYAYSTSESLYLTDCCNIPQKQVMIILPNDKKVPYPRNQFWNSVQYENDHLHELKRVRLYHFFMGSLALVCGFVFGMICVRFFRKIRRPAGPAEMKPIEELESWAATRNKKNKAMISDSSDDETDDSFFWLHLRLKAMSSKTEKLDALSQTLKETNDYLTSDVVDLILTAFPEEEEAMEAFVIIEPYLLTSVTPRDTEYSLDVVVED